VDEKLLSVAPGPASLTFVKERSGKDGGMEKARTGKQEVKTKGAEIKTWRSKIDRKDTQAG
jgi:hypothetical protein